MEQPRPIDTPIPEKFRAPVARFLSDFGIKDVESTIHASKGFEWRDSDSEPDRIIFRVVHASACTIDQDECITIVARVEDGALVADTMFLAGNKINRGDVFRRSFGARSFPWYFYSKTSVVSIVEAVKGGFIVSSEPPTK